MATRETVTDAQKVEALTDLLFEVMHTLNMKQYYIDDATQSHQCEVEVDQFQQKMLSILHSNCKTMTQGEYYDT